MPRIIRAVVGLLLPLLQEGVPLPAIRGDVSRDGYVTSADGLAILTDVVGKPIPAGWATPTFGDANCDGLSNSVDALLVLRYIVDLDVAGYCIGNGVLSVSTTSIPRAQPFSPFSYALSATGGDGSYSWAVTGGSLPPDATLSADGVLSATDTEYGFYDYGSYPFSAEVTSGDGQSAIQELALHVWDPLTIVTVSLPDGMEQVAYSSTLSLYGGDGDYGFAVIDGSLPPGLGLDAGTGEIAGTPTTPDTYPFTVEVTSGDEQAGTVGLSITIAPIPLLEITTTSLPSGLVGAPFAAPVAATGGLPALAWGVTVGVLPDGLSLNGSTGEIGGTPTTAGSSTFTVEVTSADAQTASVGLTIVVYEVLAVTTTSLADGTVGAAYSESLAASGGDGSYGWALAAGSGPLPTGLSLNGSTGEISGTPTTAGTYSFTVEVTSGDLQSATQVLSITVDYPPLAVTTTTIPRGTPYSTYGQALTATGGAGGYTWSVIAGTMHPDAELTPGGVIQTTDPMYGFYGYGTYTFTVQVTSSDAQTATQELTLYVWDPISFFTTSPLPGGTELVAYSETIDLYGGDGDYTFTVTAGSLPPGLGLGALNGTIAGTPTTAGTYAFTVDVTSGDGSTGSLPLELTIDAPPTLSITTTTLPDGLVDVAYSQTVATTGGIAPLSWTVTVGVLPDGLSLNGSTGEIGGTPTTVGSSTFTVEVTSTDAQTASVGLTIVVYEVLAVTTTSLADGTVGAAYSESLAAGGGDGSYGWALAAGSGPLPTGLSLSAGGFITGTPSAAGTFTFTVEVTSGDGQTDTRLLSITVDYPPLAVTTGSLPAGTYQVAYSQSLVASGGDGSYSWALAGGSGPLPTGLSLSAGGVISGSPSAAGTFSFTVEVTSGDAQTDTQLLSITVDYAPLLITTTTIPTGQVYSPYSQALVATGGDGSYSWSIVAGTMHPEAQLTSAGVIESTDQMYGFYTVGTYTFTVQVTSGDAQTATQELTLDVQ